MPDVALTITLPALAIDRLAGDAARENLSVERYAAQVLLADVLRRDASQDTTGAAAHPDEQAAERRAAAADKIDRDVARLVDEGLDRAEGAALAERLLAEYDLTHSPGYLDPSNTALPMTGDRHIAILRATLRADHHQRITEIEALAAEAAARGDERARRHHLEHAEELRTTPLP